MNYFLKNLIKNNINKFQYLIKKLIDHNPKYLILIYHRIVPSKIYDPLQNSVLLDEFVAQIKYLKSNKCNFESHVLKGDTHIISAKTINLFRR